MKVVIKTNLQDRIKEFKESGQDINKLMPKQIFRALTLLETAMKQRLRTDLNVRSGTLLNSVQKELDFTSPTEFEGRVGPSGNVPYAAIQNWGGIIPERFVAPRNKLALSWVSDGQRFFSKGHTLPSFEIKGVKYLEGAVEDVADKIEKELGLFIEKTISKA